LTNCPHAGGQYFEGSLMTTDNPIVTNGPDAQEPPPWQPAGAKKRRSNTEAIEETLKDVRRKIYPRAVTGWFAHWRWVLVAFTQILYYGLPWLQWNDRQAVLFDLGARKFYIFGMVLWPQDVIYLTLLLIISALALFLFTALAGRLFCGYACPQTVYSEIFMWIERKVEGDRVARIRLDESPLSFRKLRIKLTKHVLWVAVALWTGFTFIGYFAPIRELGTHLLAFALGPWQWFWLFFYSFATWGNAGFLREQVCKYMCPYARFQSVMVDSDTYVVTYDYTRGEPRGPRSKKTDYKAEGLGECVDCSICVQVCPTGIDIRKGLQYMCIGCGLCIDACNQVMEKVSYPKGLIRYTSERGILEGLNATQVRKRLLRPRVLIYSFLMLVIIGIFLGSLATRETLRVDIIRDRGALGREVPGGFIENVYRLQILNASESNLKLSITAQGLDDLKVFAGGGAKVLANDIEVGAASNLLLPVVVQAPYDAAQAGAYPIEFVTHADAVDGSRQTEVIEASSFIYPR
jgi:cytochrome c oxidase accessory protein FixG